MVSFATPVQITPCPCLPRPSLSACVTRATQPYYRGTRGDSSQRNMWPADVLLCMHVAIRWFGDTRWSRIFRDEFINLINLTHIFALLDFELSSADEIEFILGSVSSPCLFCSRSNIEAVNCYWRRTQLSHRRVLYRALFSGKSLYKSNLILSAEFLILETNNSYPKAAVLVNQFSKHC